MKTLGRTLIILIVAMLVVWGTFAFAQSDLAANIFPELSDEHGGGQGGGRRRHSQYSDEFNFQLALLGLFKNLWGIGLLIAFVVFSQRIYAETKQIHKKRKLRT